MKGVEYLFAAYGVIWVGLVLYLVALARRLARLGREVERLSSSGK